MNKKTNPSKINTENMFLMDDIQTVVKLVHAPLSDSQLKTIEALRTYNKENVVLMDDMQTVVKLVNHPLPDSLLKRIEALRTSEKKDKLLPK